MGYMLYNTANLHYKKDRRVWMIALSFAAQYLPWALVPRSTFIYHFFASVPFIILAAVLVLEYYFEKKPEKEKKITWAILVGVVVAFAIGYSSISAVPLPSWLDNFYL